MIKVTPVHLPSCPDALQAAVRERLEQPDSELLSVTLTESTPYKDQSIISRQYRAIVNRWNLVTVLHCYADGPLENQVSAPGPSCMATPCSPPPIRPRRPTPPPETVRWQRAM